ncbi:hypothetical protein [Photorhabdus kayaii]|uniref:hypothetical protein n=1 Tax=Photorhabdus kayaii TaxID=230088 RepID=UPI0021D50A9A|nr:hypothetical protein [Photorhabdus kayaii]MCT8351149.1 hypothetical protein [Photorhabdus kayaii]
MSVYKEIFPVPSIYLTSLLAPITVSWVYTLWISRCIAAARERIPGSIDNSVTGVSECSQQRGNLKDDGYRESVD